MHKNPGIQEESDAKNYFISATLAYVVYEIVCILIYLLVESHFESGGKADIDQW